MLRLLAFNKRAARARTSEHTHYDSILLHYLLQSRISFVAYIYIHTYITKLLLNEIIMGAGAGWVGVMARCFFVCVVVVGFLSLPLCVLLYLLLLFS